MNTTQLRVLLKAAALGGSLLAGARGQTNIFPASGNVGIGTTSPQALLEVRKPAGGRWQFVDEGADVYTAINIRNAANTAFLPLSIRSLGFEISDGVAARLSISNIGNVGIGTTAPNTLLTLVKNAAGQQDVLMLSGGQAALGEGPTIVLNTALGSYPTWRMAEIRSTYRNWANYESDLTFWTNSGASATNSTEKVRIMANGNVGIGTTAPGEKVTIAAPASGTSTALRVERGAGGVFWNFNLDNNSLGFAYNTQAAGQEKMVITAGGAVGIGTTNPTERLAVNGRIRAKEVIVETNWSDFVFDPGYRLTPLAEVEQHIKAHGTLPDVPSEAEVAKEGVSLGDMQARLLQKVEELTLHLIQQEKQLNEQRAQIERQNQRIRSLEATGREPADHISTR